MPCGLMLRCLAVPCGATRVYGGLFGVERDWPFDAVHERWSRGIHAMCGGGHMGGVVGTWDTWDELWWAYDFDSSRHALCGCGDGVHSVQTPAHISRVRGAISTYLMWCNC